MQAINDCSKLVAQALELLSDYVDMGEDALINLIKHEKAITLLENALAKLATTM